VLPQPHAIPPPSSPVNSNGDWLEVLREFFDWYIETYESQSRVELLGVCSTLADDDWSLDLLRSEARGGTMTAAAGIHYGFRLGVLGRLQGKISEFKRLRGNSSPSSNVTEDDDL
jgi:hypothetical protein